jgi:hypothetical protein
VAVRAQTTYIQQLRPLLGTQLEQLPAVPPSSHTHESRVAAFLAAAASAAVDTDDEAGAVTPDGSGGGGGGGASSSDDAQRALREMQLFDRWLPVAARAVDLSVVSNALDDDVSLSYGHLGELEAVVKQRQAQQLSQLSLHTREISWRALLPALTRLVQRGGGGGSGGSGGEAEFLTLYRLLYSLACANGRRGVTITRNAVAAVAPPPTAAAAAAAAAAARGPTTSELAQGNGGVGGEGAKAAEAVAEQRPARRLTAAERHAAEYAAATAAAASKQDT